MNEVSNFIKKRKLPGFLLCKKNLIRFYEKYGWVKLNKKKFKILDHKTSLYGMIYNFKKKDRRKIIRLYYND